MSQGLGKLQTHATDAFLFISHTKNVLLFKFRCNIFIGVRLITEMQESVANGTHCTMGMLKFLGPVLLLTLRTLELSSSWFLYGYSLQYIHFDL